MSGCGGGSGGGYAAGAGNSGGSGPQAVTTHFQVAAPPAGLFSDGEHDHRPLLASGAVLVTGGNTSAGIAASAELFDPVNGTFAATGSMGSARELHTATLLADGTVLVTGGLAGGPYSSAELFDPATAVFIPTVSMATERYEHSATLLKNGAVLVAGGIHPDNSFMLNSLASAELYP